MKRTRALTVVTALMLGAAGCGTGGAGGGASKDAAEKLPPGEKVSGEITFWHAYGADGNEVKQLEKKVIPAFEKEHPGTKVKPVTIQYDKLHQKLVTSAAGQSLPDVVRSDVVWVPELAELGVLVPLSDALPDFRKLSDQVYEAALETNAHKGKHYGLPLDTNTKVMLYNEQALEKAGVKSPPRTFDDLRAAAPKLAARKTFALAEADAAGWNVLPYIWSNGGEMMNKAKTKTDGHLNGKKSVEAVQLLVDLYKDKALPKLVLGKGGALPAPEGLAKGKYATTPDGPWTYPPIEKQYPDFEMKAAPMPSSDAGSISVVGGENVVVTSSSKNKKLAAEFTRFLVSPKAQMMMAETGQLSVLKSLSDDMAELKPYYGPYMKQLKTARPRPATPSWTKIDDILRKQVQLAVRGDVPVQKALDDAVEKIDPLLARD
ncbi:extracellular solute-binding protein [Streptomyces sp. WMMB 322]|uniref:extracellular solute-binding protein n=1 Tax=Streptomyces sp. WMMB 322 TaxID=1286821 RepID=UPI0006E39E7A|nr:extracellular solute-binding protein [Streptomyces sp. WMMB 322]SCK46631.1 multiple sugar transport system substrate-binding protein [Streptomyces sp. WMMB 322]